MDTCYLCGIPESDQTPLTDDHVPPKGFFRGEPPKQYITVRACNSCNGGISQLDNDMRVWLNSGENQSPAGRRIYEKFVAPKLKGPDRNISERVGLAPSQVLIPINGILTSLPAIAIWKEPANHWLFRITKGLLRHYYPDEDCTKHKFMIGVPLPTEDKNELLHQVARLCQKDSVGDGIFDFWRGRTTDGPGGIWIYIFYGSACCVVSHAKEWPEPPKKLPPIIL